MEYNENNRPKCLADCRIDWMHYPVSGENGKVTLEDCSHLRNEWLEEDCACDANNLADTVKCDKYFAFDYDYETLRLFYKIPDYEGTPFEIWGLQKMFNDNWLLTPAFVKWMGKDSFGFIVYECWLESFLNGIHDPRMRVEILKFIVKHVNYIIPDTKKMELPRLKNTLDRYEAAYKLEKKMNMENKQKRVIERNTYNNCTFNNCNNTENSYYGTPLNAQPEPSPVSTAPEADPAPADNIPDSIIFTKKTKEEGKEAAIIQALQQSVNGRKDKTRAFVNELQTWQKKGYIDAHYNARVMCDELAKLVPISFGYESFKKYYNNTRV